MNIVRCLKNRIKMRIERREPRSFDDMIVSAIVEGNKYGIDKVMHLTGVKDILYSDDAYCALTDLIKAGRLEDVKNFAEEEISPMFREYTYVYSFLDQNGRAYIATIYDSDELWQDPELYEIFPLLKNS